MRRRSRLKMLPAKPLSSAALVVYAAALALGIGTSSAYWSVAGNYPFGDIGAGPWKAWPRVGSRDADPYARSIVARRGEIPLALGEGLELTAIADDTGRELESACVYRIGSTTPQARFWTLSLHRETGEPIPSELDRSGFTSSEVLRDAGGRFTIALSRSAMPGNWLKLPEAGRFNLVLRLYDTPVAAGSAALERRALPSIERLECPS